MSGWSVIGSGVAGLCAATMLVEHGESVEVIVAPGQPTASHLAGGMLAPYCEAESAPEVVVAAGRDSVQWWAERVGCVSRHGTLVVAPPRDTPELARFARMTEQHEWIEPGRLEPDLESRFSRGLYFPDEGHLEPRRALVELRDQLFSRGVEFCRGTARWPRIDCRGIAARDRLPALRAVRGEMVILESDEIQLSRPIRLLHPRFPCYLVPWSNNRLMLGATMVESADTGPVTARALMDLLSSAYAIHPALAEARVVETGSGLRPAFPDNLPAVRYIDGEYTINGMFRHGFLLAPAMAKQLLEMISATSGSMPEPLSTQRSS
jgi:glycine oxidase